MAGRCGPGFLLYVAAHREDTQANASKLADRVFGMRVFPDAEGKMNLALRDLEPSLQPRVLAISNFTLYGDATQRRPSFVAAAPYEAGKSLFEAFVEALRGFGVVVETGVFGAEMEVESTNLGPITVIADA